MASADHNHLHTDSVPVIDLRLLSQSELYFLSVCSSSSNSSSHLHRRCDDDVLIPKIDRSVFNESAGSRKQTFSRLRLAPRNSQIPSSTSNSICTSTSTSTSALHIPGHNYEENVQIIAILKRLFGAESFHCEQNNDFNLVPVQVQLKDSIPGFSAASFQNIPIDVVDGVQGKRKRGRPRKNETMVANMEQKAKKEETESVVMVNRNGILVDAAALANLEDPFEEELRRRTLGLRTVSELLGFLGSLRGEWATQRKRRRIVQASDFGDLLPRGWKIMLSLKRRAGHVWIFCRRYIRFTLLLPRI